MDLAAAGDGVCVMAEYYGGQGTHSAPCPPQVLGLWCRELLALAVYTVPSKRVFYGRAQTNCSHVGTQRGFEPRMAFYRGAL